MKYSRIIRAIENEVWALEESKLDAICEFMRLKSEGVMIEFDAVAPPEVVIYKAPDGSKPTKPNGIAVLPLAGVITAKANLMTSFSGGTSLQVFKNQFRSAMNDPEISTIVLDTDSPGGGVHGVEEMADEIYAANDTKRIISVANHSAASAAYWLSSQAKEFVVSPSGEIGSIGVFAVHEDHSALLDKAGIKVRYISAGKYKTESASEMPLSDDAAAFIQERVDGYYNTFTKAVGRGRGYKTSDVVNGFGEGRMIPARQAVKMGMADGVATLDQVISRLQSGQKSLLSAENDAPEAKAEENDNLTSDGLPDEDIERWRKWSDGASLLR